MRPVRKVGVVGAGVMGAGIAAQVANAGVPVVLLDLVPDGAARAVERMLKTEPAAFMSPRAAKLVTTGSSETDLGLLAECDWIVEAIIERPDAKQALYRRIDEVRRPGTVVSSNTSTIPLGALIGGLGEAFARDFLITHFFNPPRYMRLLEVVAGPRTDPATVEAVAAFADRAMGKTVVHCNDSPGFIANRLGTLWIQLGLVEAIDAGLTVEQADAVMGRPFGIPKTGIFGLVDLVGLDLMPHVNASMARLLPKSDAFHTANREIPLVGRMIESGLTGRKGKGGFYRRARGADGARVKEAIDLATGEYRASSPADLPVVEAAARDPRALLDDTSPAGRYAWRVMGPTLAYAASLLPEAAGDIVAIDTAMRLGYNWRFGPFELIDKVGSAWLIERLERDGIAVPSFLRVASGRTFYHVEGGKRQALGLDGAYHDVVRPDGVLLLEDIKLTAKPILKNGSASLWDIGDGVACFEFTSKSNSLDEAIITLLVQSIGHVGARMKALVIYNEGTNFSVGANLGQALFAANIAAWSEIEKSIAGGQKVYQSLKYAPFPTVAAPAGMALGGGCEMLMHCSAVQAHAELYAGLVEAGVGLVPGWGGCTELLGRWSTEGKLPHGPMPAPAKVFEMVSTAAVSKSAAEAREMLILRESDGITMNRDRLLADAKARALSMVEGYAAPAPREIVLPGPSGRVALTMAAESFAKRGLATPYDMVVAGALADVLSGGETDIIDTVTEDQIMTLERTNFMHLLRQPGTLARIEHMLDTGKPLRN
jgi:3-hydroxyacyl-CoA dehydrogenase